MSNHLSRRNWLKKSLITTGGLVTGISTASRAGYTAFGMKPAYTHALADHTDIPMQDRSLLKARLTSNENPFGPSKNTIAAIAEAAAKGNRYPMDASKKMIETLAAKEGVVPEQILIAPGSSDLLETTAFMLCARGGNVISADPSYMSLVKSATALGATWKNIPLRSDYAHDLEAMEKAIDVDTKLVYICNPNNPTGTLTPIEGLREFCKRVSPAVPVFVDEAYLELLDDHDKQSTVGLIQQGYDIIVCRTFSKIHGMAGLRMGYAVAKKERIESLQGAGRPGMGLSITTLEGAMASLADIDFQNYSRTNNKINRDYTMQELKKANLQPIPSFTNFILFPIEMPTRVLVDAMMKMGVGMRGFDINGKPFGRVSIGTMEEMKLFSKCLAETLS
ncbi:MAG TPA: histidinol-phosphate transaminase [Chryseolinea sp.]|nr:histidinol-phosphate transaminase [Chryseolinea sp.]